jgi:hypothetical protein
MSNADPPLSDDLAKRILGSMKKKFSGEQTSKWLNNLDSLPERLNPEGTIAPTKESVLPVHSLTDRLFDEFQRYAFEFNKNPVGKDLMVQVERPTAPRSSATQTNIRPGEQKVLANGHASTRHFGLVLKIYESRIRAFVIPIDHIVAFYSGHGDFDPFLEIEAVQAPNGLVWRVKKDLVTPQSLPVLAKKLFSALIRVANGEALFTDPLNARASGSEAAAAAPSPMEKPPSYRSQEGFELLRPDPTVPPQGRNPKAPPQQGQHQAQHFQSGSAPTGSGALFNAFDNLIKTLDEELNQITQYGIQVLQAQDLEAMQVVMKRTTALKSAREQVAAIAEECRNS